MNINSHIQTNNNNNIDRYERKKTRDNFEKINQKIKIKSIHKFDEQSNNSEIIIIKFNNQNTHQIILIHLDPNIDNDNLKNFFLLFLFF